jgi:hypothetical protein
LSLSLFWEGWVGRNKGGEGIQEGKDLRGDKTHSITQVVHAVYDADLRVER